MVKIFLILLLTSSLISYTTTIVASPFNQNNPLYRLYASNCITQIIKTFEHGFLTMTSTKNMTYASAEIESNVMKKVHEAINWTTQVIGDGRIEHSQMYVAVPKGYPAINKQNKHLKCNYYVVVVDTMENFVTKLEQIIYSKSFNPKALFVVYITYFKIDFKKRAFDMLDFLWHYRILNSVVVIPQHSLTSNNIYGLFPYEPAKKCGKKRRLELLDTCDYGKRKNEHFLFPQKVPRTFNNCSIKVVAIDSPPSVINVYNFSGFEMEILRTVSMKLNISFEYSVKNKSSFFVKRSNSSQWRGALKFIKENSAIGIGNMYANGEIYEDFEVTHTYHFEHLSWVAPRANPAPRWKCLIVIFEPRLWLACLAVYITSSVLFYVMGYFAKELQMYKQFSLSFLNALSVLLSIAMPKLPRSRMLRIVFFLTALFGMISASLYQSALINVLTNPLYEKQISTQEEILESDLSIGGLEAYKTIFDDPHTRNIYQLFKTNPKVLKNVYDWLVRVASFKDTCTVSNKFYVMYVQASGDKGINNKKGIDQLFILRKNIMTYPVHMIVARGFPLYDEFNRVIIQIITGGFTVKYISEINYAINRRKKTATTHDEDDDIRLTVGHLQGAFAVLIVGNVTATVVFLLELIFHKIQNSKRCLQWYDKHVQIIKNCLTKETKKGPATTKKKSRKKRKTAAK